MSTAMIQFKGKVRRCAYSDPSKDFDYIPVPSFTRNHCVNMQAWRNHPKYGYVANSDLFESVLRGISKRLFGSETLKLNAVPAGVRVDASGFLAVVTIEV